MQNNTTPAVPKLSPGAAKNRKNSVTVDIPLPGLGETSELRIERYGLTILVERDSVQTQENIQARFGVVAPISPDQRTHAVRIGAGPLKGKKIGTTLCKEGESRSEQPKTGVRIALTLDSVLCVACRKALVSEGVELKQEEL